MIVACSGIASPMSSRVLIPLSTQPRPRTMANAARNEISTAGTIEPTVTITLLRKYRGKSDSTTSA